MFTDGLMQRTPLLISSILKYAAIAHPRREVVSRRIEGGIWRYGYAQLERRAGRAARALLALGVKTGDRVSTLSWNTHRHLELFYAAPGFGAVLHTANPRLFDDQIAYTINHAGSGVLLFDAKPENPGRAPRAAARQREDLHRPLRRGLTRGRRAGRPLLREPDRPPGRRLRLAELR